MRRALVVIVGVLALAAPALPASAAAPLDWKDADGDAITYLVIDDAKPAVPEQRVGVPTPNEPALDILRVQMQTRGDTLVWTADIKNLSKAPQNSTGQSFVFFFTYGGIGFYFSAVEDTFWGNTSELRVEPGAGPSTATLSCVRCVAKMDRKSSKLVVTLPIASLSGGMRGADRKLKPLAAGSKLEKIRLTANRTYTIGHGDYAALLSNYLSDEAVPPKNAPFVI